MNPELFEIPGYWREVSKCDREALDFAKPHYSRASPESSELGPPGQKIVLMGKDGKALWGSHRPAPWSGVKRMDGFDGHSCFIFRNEGGPLSSEIIREAIGITALRWGIAPFITYVATEKIRRKRDPGRCFVKAGFRPISFKERTKHGKMLRLEMGKEAVGDCLRELCNPMTTIEIIGARA